MTFKFHCTCGQKVSATDDMIGTSAVCPRCGSNVIIPRPSGFSEPARASAPPPAPAPAAAPAAPPLPKPPRTSMPVAPLTVVPRPMGLLHLAATVAILALLGTVAYVFRTQLFPMPKSAVPMLLGVTVGMFIGSLIVATFLRLAVRIAASFDLAFAEAWLVTLFTSALDLLAVMPAALVQLRMMRPEEGAKLLSLTFGLDVLLTIIAFSFLIRNALGRPIGIGRGIFTYLLRLVLFAILGGVVFGVMTLVKLRS